VMNTADGMRVYGQKLRDYPDRSHFKLSCKPFSNHMWQIGASKYVV